MRGRLYIQNQEDYNNGDVGDQEYRGKVGVHQ